MYNMNWQVNKPTHPQLSCSLFSKTYIALSVDMSQGYPPQCLDMLTTKSRQLGLGT